MSHVGILFRRYWLIKLFSHAKIEKNNETSPISLHNMRIQFEQNTTTNKKSGIAIITDNARCIKFFIPHGMKIILFQLIGNSIEYRVSPTAIINIYTNLLIVEM